MKLVSTALLAIVLACVAAPAAAQSASSPIVNLWYVGANTGGAAVENFAGVVGAEAGVRVWKSLDLLGEFVWYQDLVTRRQLDKAATIVDYLQQTQGGSASADVNVPTNYFGVGARWVFEQAGRFRPYIIVTVGGARFDRQPEFTLDGADITGVLPQYGVTLGSDLIGKSREAAFGGGFGMVMPYGERWYFDVGARFSSIGGDEQRTNVSRLVLGGGYRF